MAHGGLVVQQPLLSHSWHGAVPPHSDVANTVGRCTADLGNLATGSKSLGSRYLGYGLCDIIVVYNFGS